MRALDRLLQRDSSGTFWEGMASGASVLTTSYGSPDRESILPNLASFATEAYNSNTIVFGAILARLMLFSEATFKYQNLLNKKLFGDNTPDGLTVLENPWPNGTTGELLARMIQDVDLAGNCYIIRGEEHLFRLRPDQVTIVSHEVRDNRTGNTYREVIGYSWDPNPLPGIGPSDDVQYYDVSEVAHWSPIPDPVATFKGMSWLTPVIREIQADNQMTTYKMQYLNNAASPNLLIKYKGPLQPGTIDALRERMEARYGGASNAFKTLVLDQGADATTIGNSFEQMQFATVQAAGENRILIASGVPGIVIGSKEGLMAATYSNYSQAMRRFSDITMRPLWRSCCACLSRLITIPGPSRLWFDTSDIAALRQDQQEAATTMLAQSQAIGELVRFGYEPLSARDAVMANDMSLLKHPGIPVMMLADVPRAAPEPVKLAAPGAPPPTSVPAPTPEQAQAIVATVAASKSNGNGNTKP